MLEERIREMEADLERITGVQSARIRVDGGRDLRGPRRGRSDRRPKWIVRDVVTTLFARHGIRDPAPEGQRRGREADSSRRGAAVPCPARDRSR